MAGERMADLAVETLTAYVQNNLPARLRAVEVEKGLAVGYFVNPVDYVPANLPSDLRTPLVEVFDSQGRCIDQRNDEWEITCGVALSFSGDADLIKNERSMRGYITAMRDVLRASSTLGGVVRGVTVDNYSADAMRGDTSVTRYVFAFGVQVRVKA